MRRLLAVSAIGVIFTIIALLAGTGTAQAATGWERCPSGYSCYFSQVDGQGSIWIASSPGWHDLPFEVVSDWNRGGGDVGFYIGYTFTGWISPVGYQGSNGALAANRIYIVDSGG